MCHRNRQFLQQPPVSIQSLLEEQQQQHQQPTEPSNPPHSFMDKKMEAPYSGDPFHFVQSLVNPLGIQGPFTAHANNANVTSNHTTNTTTAAATASTNYPAPGRTPRTSTGNGKKRISQEDKARITHNWDNKVPKAEILSQFQIGESTFYRIIKDRAFPPQNNSCAPRTIKAEIKRRAIISQEEKVGIIQSWENKVSRTDIMGQFHIGESTFYRIIKDRDRVLPASSLYSMRSPKAVVKRRNVVSLEEKVRIIYNWENKVPKKEIQNQFQIGESTFYRILKQRGQVTLKYTTNGQT